MNLRTCTQTLEYIFNPQFNSRFDLNFEYYDLRFESYFENIGKTGKLLSLALINTACLLQAFQDVTLYLLLFAIA